MARHGENIRKRTDGRWEARYIERYENGKAKYRYVYAKSFGYHPLIFKDGIKTEIEMYKTKNKCEF